MTKLLSVTECAARRGVTRAAILRAIERGKLPATRIGNAYAIAEMDCEGYSPMTKAEAGAKSGEARRAKAESVEKPKRGRGRPKKSES